MQQPSKRLDQKSQLTENQTEKSKELTDAELKIVQNSLWARGELSFLFNKAQKKIYKKFKGRPKGQKLFVANVARQTGKTFMASILAISQALKQNNSSIAYVSKTATDLNNFIIPTFEKILNMGPPALKPSRFKQEGKYEFKNGSIIRFSGLDKNPDAPRGNTYDMVVFEEAGFIEKLDYVYSSVVIPATRQRPDATILMISTPPKTPGHPFKNFCYLAEEKDSYIKMPIWDIPDITKKQVRIAKAECLTMTDYEREYGCEFVVDSDLAIIPEFTKLKDEIVDNFKIPPHFIPFTSLDLGYVDNTGVLMGHYDYLNATINIEDEFLTNKNTSDKIVAAVVEKERKLWRGRFPEWRVYDGQPQQLADLCKLHNFQVSPPRKSNLEAMVNEVRIAVKDKRIRIHPRCVHLIRELQEGIWDTTRKKFARVEVGEKRSHYDLIAALVYFVRAINKYDNPYPGAEIPSSYFIPKQTQWQIDNDNSEILTCIFDLGDKNE